MKLSYPRQMSAGSRAASALKGAVSYQRRLFELHGAPWLRPMSCGAFHLTMRSSGLRGEAIVFPDALSARSRLTRR
jgi:hypothetical protein